MNQTRLYIYLDILIYLRSYIYVYVQFIYQRVAIKHPDDSPYHWYHQVLGHTATLMISGYRLVKKVVHNGRYFSINVFMVTPLEYTYTILFEAINFYSTFRALILW